MEELLVGSRFLIRMYSLRVQEFGDVEVLEMVCYTLDLLIIWGVGRWSGRKISDIIMLPPLTFFKGV